MADIRPPGVYFERVEERRPPLVLGPSGHVGFLGLCTRGPLHTPVCISELDEFFETFGLPVEGGYLADSVRGFFENGGKICYVVRVAHTFARGDSEVAAVATAAFVDKTGADVFRIDASSEGEWGNEVRVKVKTPAMPKAQTLLVRDVSAGDNKMQVRSSRGFEQGTICKLDDGKKQEYVTVARVEGKDLIFASRIKGGFKSSAPTFVQPMTFDIEAEMPGNRERFDDLSFSPLSARYFERFINQSSLLIRVRRIPNDTPFPECVPENVDRIDLTGGTDGLDHLLPADFIGSNDGPGQRYGLGALEVVDDIDLIAIPDLFSAREFSRGRGFRSAKDVEAVQDAMITHCERLANRIALLDVPPSANHEQVLQWRLQFDSAFAAFYFPWLVIPLEGRRRRAIPPSGFIGGLIARSDATYGVHKPPANEIVEGIVDLDVLLSDEHLGVLNSQGINCIRNIHARGLRVWGARTISSDIQWRYLNVRRIVNALRYAVEHGTQWIVFEPNTPGLWKSITRDLSFFMEDLWRKGFFQGKSPDEGFYVICDSSTNPPENVDAGVLVCEIGVAPVRPAEFIAFRIHQHMEDRATEDANLR